MEIDRNVENIIRDQIETLKRTNAEMRQQVEQEINKNAWLIYALEKLLEEHKNSIISKEKGGYLNGNGN